MQLSLAVSVLVASLLMQAISILAHNHTHDSAFYQNLIEEHFLDEQILSPDQVVIQPLKRGNFTKRDSETILINLTFNKQVFPLLVAPNYGLFTGNAQYPSTLPLQRLLAGVVEDIPDAYAFGTLTLSDMFKGVLILPDGKGSYDRIRVDPQTDGTYHVYRQSSIQASSSGEHHYCPSENLPRASTPPPLPLGDVYLNSQGQSNILRKRSTFDETPTCQISMTLDKSFVDQYQNENEALLEALAVFQEVQFLLEKQIFIRLPLLHVAAITSSQDPSGLGTNYIDSMMTMLNMATQAVNAKQLPENYAAIVNDVCIHHFVAHRSFDSILGLAWPSNVCMRSTNNRNVGCTTSNNRGATLRRSQWARTMAHELSHNLGSMHDASPGYLMSESLQRESNVYGDILSPVSKQSIEKVRQEDAACMLPDRCLSDPRVQKETSPSGRPYVRCNVRYDESDCFVVCADPANPQKCYRFYDGNQQLQWLDQSTTCSITSK